MKYMGSKRKIVDDILPIMLDNEHETFVDLFCGGCHVIEKVPATYRRIANDKNRYLIAMWKSLTEGKKFCRRIPRELYNDVRDCYNGKNDRYQDDMIGWVGFMGSFNGRFFDGGYSGHHVVRKSNQDARDLIDENIRNTERQIEPLGGGWSSIQAITKTCPFRQRASSIVLIKKQKFLPLMVGKM